jgi:putative N6-adenine-specific DNA methylase
MPPTTPPERHRAFAIAAPGLAPIVAAELRAVPDARDVVVDDDGVSFEAGEDALYAANLLLRTASRVLVRVAEFRARTFAELERHARAAHFERYVAAGHGVRLRVTCHKSRLYHSAAVAQRVGEAIVRRTGATLAGEAGVREDGAAAQADADSDSVSVSQLFVTRLLHDRVTISVDSSGALLHQRGYRQAVAKAPLRETLAAAMLIAAGWSDADAPRSLVDPMCGSGTIPIEAALIARRMAPGRTRAFAFQQWPGFDDARWQALVARARDLERPLPPGITIAGSDRDAGAIDAARANAERAGVAGDVAFTRTPLSAIAPPAGTGLLIANPPYGVRVGERGPLRDLYARLGHVARARCPGWTLALLSADRLLERQVRVPLTQVFRTNNGGIPVRLVMGTIGNEA